MAGPELALLDLLLERRDQLLALRAGEIVGAAEDEPERFDLIPDELVNPVQLVLKLRVCFEVPGHGSSPVASVVGRWSQPRQGPADWALS